MHPSEKILPEIWLCTLRLFCSNTSIQNIAEFKVCMINTGQNILSLCRKLCDPSSVEKTLDKTRGIALGKTLEKH